MKPLDLLAAFCGLKSEMQSLSNQHFPPEFGLGDHLIVNGLEFQMPQFCQGIFQLIEINKLNFIETTPANARIHKGAVEMGHLGC